MKGIMRKKFTCLKCGEDICAPVLDVKTIYSGFRRYRQCEKCGVVFVTIEKADHITGWRSWNREQKQYEATNAGNGERAYEQQTGSEKSSEAN